MKQPKISKELLELVYPGFNFKWKEFEIGEYSFEKFRAHSITSKRVSLADIVHDMKVFFSENIKPYKMIIDENQNCTSVLRAGLEEVIIKQFWCDEKTILFDPQRVFDACEWIIENCEKE